MFWPLTWYPPLTVATQVSGRPTEIGDGEQLTLTVGEVFETVRLNAADGGDIIPPTVSSTVIENIPATVGTQVIDAVLPLHPVGRFVHT
jgi:hypothetical protein